MNLPSTLAEDLRSITQQTRQDISSMLTSHFTVSLSGQPVVATTREANLPVRYKKAVAQEFAFVNSTGPGKNRDPDVRRLVRGHVVRDTTRRKRLQREREASSSEDILSSSSQSSGGEAFDRGGSISLNAEQAAVAISRKYLSAPIFPTQGMDPHPHLSPYLYRITALGDAMYPLVSSFRVNPISPVAWFDCALRDEALFHALLYITCVYADLITGTAENQEAIEHGGKSITLIKQRIDRVFLNGTKSVHEFVEENIRAVSCLAITEAIKGNTEGWRIHMSGLKQMVELKGGLTKMEVGIQLKLHRADLLGALDFIEMPFFDEGNSLPDVPSRYEEPPEERGEGMAALLNTLPISDVLHDALAYMHSLSVIVSRILASKAICSGAQQVSWQKHAAALRYSLLRGLGKCDSQDEEKRVLDETLRIGALLYVQATPQEFPFSAVGPAKLIARLKELVLGIQMRNEKEASLVIWLLFMGGISVRKGEDKVWFVAQLEKLTARLSVLEWELVSRRLETLWWVGPVHEKPCKTLWNKVVALRMVGNMHGSFSQSSL
ncbi:uncharacterized protein PAC_14190 [Phialocephala subalpina]|uniref:Tachykinin family protein n=1 Tax=Phialocephala subalpina TaxID=576137 RepID=A0A1L7XGZ6_9HELO|nr:uncharacterized protein PAC_14190 [Phialocephala subalpina]